MDSQQLHRDEQNRADFSQPDASQQLRSDSPYQQDHGRPAGTDVMGEPVNPLHAPASSATATSHVAASPPSAAGSGGATPISPTSKSGTAPAYVPNASPASAGNFPTAQMPQALSSHANQYGASQQPTAQTASPSPYVQTSSVPRATGKTPMDSIMQVFNKWSKKAEDMTGNVWHHLRTGPNVADTALGRIAVGTKAMAEGGIENVYRQTFEVAPDEHLLKTYACYLSTSTGPVAGTLYISSHKLAFCSDRPLAIPATQLAGTNNTANRPAPGATSTPSKNTSAGQQQQQYCYYKMMVPISHVESVNPSENTQKKPPEKYVQVKTTDGHEFWFMGFVNYEKGVRNLQETLLSKTTSTSPTAHSTSHVASTSPTTHSASHVVN